MGGLLQGLIDCLQHSIHLLKDVVVPNAQDVPPVRGKPGIPLPVMGGLFIAVLSAIYLYNQLTLYTREVCEIWADRELAAKLVSACTAQAESLP